MIIAMDGPAGAGKGTISRALAHRFGLKSIDSGLMYRALAFKALAEKQPLTDDVILLNLLKTVTPDDLSNPDLRLEITGNAASKVAIYPAVRDAINARLVTFCKDVQLPYKGIIMDGRDIGTVVYPNADVKFFVTANAVVRASRRAHEMSTSQNIPVEAVLQQILERDLRDSERGAAPLKQAHDAHMLDTTDLSITDSCALAIQIVDEYLMMQAEEVKAQRVS